MSHLINGSGVRWSHVTKSRNNLIIGVPNYTEVKKHMITILKISFIMFFMSLIANKSFNMLGLPIR